MSSGEDLSMNFSSHPFSGPKGVHGPDLLKTDCSFITRDIYKEY
jgi:hypothetical protein